MYKIDKIIKDAKKLLPTVKSRSELVKILAEKYNLSIQTASNYLTMAGFSTGFDRGKNSVLKVLEKIKERPRFTSDFNSLEKSILYKLCRKGIVKDYRYNGKKIHTVYYLPHQNYEAYNLLKARFGFSFNKKKKNVLLALGIPYYSKQGRYYHKITGEEL